MRGHHKKGELKIEASLYNLYWGFKKIPFYTYVLAKILQNDAKFIWNLTPGFKNHMRDLGNFKQAVENSKGWNMMGYFCQKNAFVQKIHSFSQNIFRENWSNITFNYLRENSPNSLCHFWNRQSFFTTQLLCIFLAQKLYTLYKSSLWKQLSNARIKIHQVPHVIFQTKSQFFVKVLIPFQCLERYFFCTF